MDFALSELSPLPYGWPERLIKQRMLVQVEVVIRIYIQVLWGPDS